MSIFEEEIIFSEPEKKIDEDDISLETATLGKEVVFSNRRKKRGLINDTHLSTIGKGVEFFQNDAAKKGTENAGSFTKDFLESMNENASTYEEVFANTIMYAIYQDELTQHAILYKTAETLLKTIQTGYVLNISDPEFIKNIILLFQYGKGDVFDELLKRIPDILSIVLKYHHTQQIPIHFWLDKVTTELSLKDILGAFNLQPSFDNNINEDKATIEPYCLAIDAALQQFDFDTGHWTKIDIFTHLMGVRRLFLELKRNKVLNISDIKMFSKAFPYTYQFLVEESLTIDYGCFINGLRILSNMIFGGPNEIFFKEVTLLLINNKAYTLPFCDHGVPLPSVLYFPLPRTIDFYIPFIISE